MADESGKKPGIRLDLAVNLPTIFTLISIISAGVVYVNDQFNGVRGNQMIAAADIRVLEQRQTQSEREIADLKNNTSQQINQLRVEVREDLREIKDSVREIAGKRG